MIHYRARHKGWTKGSTLSRDSTIGLCPKPQPEHVKDIGPALVCQSSSTSVLKVLLVWLLTHLESAPLSLLGVPLALNIASLYVSVFEYAILRSGVYLHL